MESVESAGERQERREREMDALARLAVHAGEHRLDPAEAANAEFHEWLACDARAGQRSGERRATEARAERFARRMQALVLSRHLGVAHASSDPVVRELRTESAVH